VGFRKVTLGEKSVLWERRFLPLRGGFVAMQHQILKLGGHYDKPTREKARRQDIYPVANSSLQLLMDVPQSLFHLPYNQRLLKQARVEVYNGQAPKDRVRPAWKASGFLPAWFGSQMVLGFCPNLASLGATIRQEANPETRHALEAALRSAELAWPGTDEPFRAVNAMWLAKRPSYSMIIVSFEGFFGRFRSRPVVVSNSDLESDTETDPVAAPAAVLPTIAASPTLEETMAHLVPLTKDWPSLSRFLVCVGGLYMAGNVASFSATLYLYLAGEKLGRKLDAQLRKMVVKLARLVEQCASKAYSSATSALGRTLEGADPAVEVEKGFAYLLSHGMVREAFERVSVMPLLGTAVGRAFMDVVQCFSLAAVVGGSVLFFSPGDFHSLQLRVESYMARDALGRPKSIDTVLVSLFAFLRQAVVTITDVVRTGDLSMLYTNTLDVTTWMEVSHAIIHDEALRAVPNSVASDPVFLKRRATGQIPAYFTRQLSAAELGAEMQNLVEMAVPLQKRHASDGVMRVSITRMTHALATARTTWMNLPLHQAPRVQPFGVYFYGPAMSGKSNLAHSVGVAIGRVNNYALGVGSSFRFQPGSNFADGFQSTMWHGKFDDVDQGMAQESASVKSFVQWVLDVINNEAMNMEAADVESKGKKDAAFQLVTYTSNFATGRLKGRIVDPMPFWRRFPVRVRVEVLTAFANAVGGIDEALAIDPMTKALVPDCRVFHIERFKPVQTGDTFTNPPYEVVASVRTECELYAALNHLYAKFMTKQVELVTRQLSSAGDEAFCALCGQVAAMHGVGAYPCQPVTNVQLEGAFDDFSWTARWLAVLLPAVLWGYWHYATSRLTSVVDVFLGEMAYVAFWLEWKLLRVVGPTRVGERMRAAIGSRLVSALDGPHRRLILGGAAAAVAAVLVGVIGFLRHRRSAADVLTDEVFVRRAMEGVDPTLPPKGAALREDNYIPLARQAPRAYVNMRAVTTTIDELARAVEPCIVQIRSNGRLTVNGILLDGGYFLTVRHAFVSHPEAYPLGCREPEPEADWYTFAAPDGQMQSVMLTTERFAVVNGRDMCVAYVPEIVKLSKFDILKHICPTSVLAQGGLAADSGGLVVDGVVKMATKRLRAMPGTFLSVRREWTGDYESLPGDCGRPVIATFGQTILFVGMHCYRASGVEGTCIGAEELVRSEIEAARDSLRVPLRVIAPLHVSLEGQLGVQPELFGDLPRRSSLAAALVHPTPPVVLFLGTSPRLATTRKPKTFVKDTWFRADVAELEREVCGVSPYFVAPVFKGEKDEYGWIDPYVLNLISSRNTGGDVRVWNAAVDDYLAVAEALPGSQLFVPLTDAQTMLGIEGTTVGGTNMQSSAGLPFQCKKERLIKVDRSGVGEPVVTWDPRLDALVKEIQATWDRGEVYVAGCTHTLKDEVVTEAKNEAHKIRVFNNLSFAYNFMTKKYLGPVVTFMREHPLFFESVVGMHLGSAYLDFVCEHLEEYGHLLAADSGFFDVRASTLENLAACEVLQRVSALLGYTTVEQNYVSLCLRGLVYMMRVINGDVFLTSYMMPTGCWLTIWLNCIRNALQSRYAWVKLGYGAATMRRFVHSFDLGDDLIASVSSLYPGYNQISVAAALVEIGAVRTSCVKDRDLPAYEKWADVTFLKRSFRRLGGVRVCPIERKTLVKMLCMRGRSELTDVEHHCVVVSNVLAESWMHGIGFFEKMLALCRRLIAKYELMGPYLRVFSYDEYAMRYARGDLSVWDPLRNGEEEVVDLGFEGVPSKNPLPPSEGGAPSKEEIS